jgi:hypothetical protein
MEKYLYVEDENFAWSVILFLAFMGTKILLILLIGAHFKPVSPFNASTTVI